MLFLVLWQRFLPLLVLCPPTPVTYAIGYAGYALSSGLAFTAFNTLVLDVVGHRRRAAATGYSLIAALGYIGFGYMTLLDGMGYRNAGVHGLVGVDALANGSGGFALLLVAHKFAPLFSTSRKNI